MSSQIAEQDFEAVEEKLEHFLNHRFTRQCIRG